MSVLSPILYAVQKIMSQRSSSTLPETSIEWEILGEHLNKSKRIIDLGCGANPHPKAMMAVDAFLEPEQRGLGQGPFINAKTFSDRAVHFIQADLSSLPFADKEFDFAYSHHVFEHLPDPKKACKEMCRIAGAGAIITPSVFAEVSFGRPYHLWFVMARGNRLIFIRKTEREDRPFGNHPMKNKKGKFVVTPESNPFDILLNDNGWYRGREQMPRLSAMIRNYWYSHSPVMEVIFLWKNSFECTVIYEDGSIE